MNEFYKTPNDFKEIEHKETKKTAPLSHFLGTWSGDDAEQIMELIYKTRSKF